MLSANHDPPIRTPEFGSNFLIISQLVSRYCHNINLMIQTLESKARVARQVIKRHGVHQATILTQPRPCVRLLQWTP